MVLAKAYTKSAYSWPSSGAEVQKEIALKLNVEVTLFSG
jgi:hypothetical protein